VPRATASLGAQPKARAKAEPNPTLPRDAAPPHVDSCPEPRRRGARAGAGGSWALAARHATREPEPGPEWSASTHAARGLASRALAVCIAELPTSRGMPWLGRLTLTGFGMSCTCTAARLGRQTCMHAYRNASDFSRKW